MSKTMNIQEIQEEIVDEFSFFESWEDKYKFIIDLGRELEAYPEDYRDEKHKVRGCQSQVWLHASMEDGKMNLKADSDALIPKGLISLLLRIFSKQNPGEIRDSEVFFIDRIGLSNHLTPTRSNGLHAMIKKIKIYAAEKAAG